MNNHIKVVSFDVEGTLVTTDFSYAIWFEMIPELYAARHSIEPAQALEKVKQEYNSIGDQYLEWYDVQYWFTRFELGQADIAMEKLQHRVHYFPETNDVLKNLGKEYQLSVASGSPRQFLKHLLRGIDRHFNTIFSSTSDFKNVKMADFYIKMCHQLKIQPEQVVHVGDNFQFDYSEPRSIGIQSYYLDREGRSGKPGILRNLTQLVQMLDGR
jgi:HAD superfamily hydrolase (TIGR01549 family)